MSLIYNKLDQNGTNWTILDQIGLNWITLDQIDMVSEHGLDKHELEKHGLDMVLIQF